MRDDNNLVTQQDIDEHQKKITTLKAEKIKREQSIEGLNLKFDGDVHDKKFQR